MPGATQTVTLYLEGWQQRMAQDFCGTGKKIRFKFNAAAITFRPGGCPASYKIPVDGMRKGDWVLYLTESQMMQVKEQLGLRTAISSINITPNAMKEKTVVFR